MATHLALRALFGAVCGAVLFLSIVYGLPLTFDLKVTGGCVFTVLCTICGMSSSFFRCSVLLMFPSMLGPRGQTYLRVFILSLLYAGPVSNIQKNMEAAALSVTCNLDLQVQHARLLWRDAVRPFTLISQQLMDEKAAFESEALSVSQNFQAIRDEVVAQYGYKQSDRRPAANNTQQQLTTRTKMQCDGVVDEGVQHCSDWFSRKWAECLKAIFVPVISHILCVPMKFHALCDIVKVMTPWCREQVPVEGNFGQLFDQLNVSVDQLSKEFSTNLVLEEHQQQDVLGGDVLDQEFTQAVRRSFQKLTTVTKRVVDVLQLLLSFTIVTIFIRSSGYVRQYRTDIQFDNVYITAYFRRIDARRRRSGRHGLLPLTESEKKKMIDPKSLKIHPEEFKEVMSGALQVLAVSLLCIVILAVDFSLVHVLDIISRHTVTQFNLSSNHQVDIRVNGASMMARLLRRTVSAFNASSSSHIQTDNQSCVSPPSSLTADVYVWCVSCMLLMALFTCLQVYANRLRRVVAAFYHPEREKKRVLFLYNLQMQRRIYLMDNKHTVTRGQPGGTSLSRRGRLWCHRRLRDMLCRKGRLRQEDV